MDVFLIIFFSLKWYYFIVDGVSYSLVFFDYFSEFNDGEWWVDVFSKIVVIENSMMGGLAMLVYYFLIDVDGVNGGLEYVDSCCVVFFSGLIV